MPHTRAPLHPSLVGAVQLLARPRELPGVVGIDYCLEGVSGWCQHKVGCIPEGILAPPYLEFLPPDDHVTGFEAQAEFATG